MVEGLNSKSCKVHIFPQNVDLGRPAIGDKPFNCYENGSWRILTDMSQCPFSLPGWYLRQKPVGGGEVRQVVSPTLPFPLSLPSPFPFSLSFQTNQWEGRSDPVRGNFPSFPPTDTTLCK